MIRVNSQSFSLSSTLKKVITHNVFLFVYRSVFVCFFFFMETYFWQKSGMESTLYICRKWEKVEGPLHYCSYKYCIHTIIKQMVQNHLTTSGYGFLKIFYSFESRFEWLTCKKRLSLLTQELNFFLWNS